jgi:mitochondrial import inner membrane translocase subunit TIM22
MKGNPQHGSILEKEKVCILLATSPLPLPPAASPFKLREDNRVDHANDAETASISNDHSSSSSSSSSSGGNKNNDFRKLSIYEMILSNRRDETSLPESFANNRRFYSYQNALHRPVTVSVGSSSNNNSKNKSTTNNNDNNSDNNNYSLDYLTRQSLPYPQPWYATAGPNEVAPDFSWLSNSCGGKAAIGVFGGGIMGLLMGVFLGAMSDATPPIQVIGGKDVPQAPLREQVKVTMRATADKSLYWCRNFAFITGVFSGSECLVEKYRGTHDVWNSVASGCITGAALQAKSGPQAAAMGCGGFAAFSLVIDSVMGNY